MKLKSFTQFIESVGRMHEQADLLLPEPATLSSSQLKPVTGQKMVCSHIAAIDGGIGTRAENSLKNIGLLIENGVDMIEMDIQITSDRVPVLFHDADLGQKTNGRGSISSMTWSELQRVRYRSDGSQGITRFSDAVDLLRQSGRPTIFQLDKCDRNEIAEMSRQGLFRGLEGQMLAKSLSFQAPSQISSAGIQYMPILPTKYVGTMNTEPVIDDIVNSCRGQRFLELQFSEEDSLVLDGTLARRLSETGCQLLVVAIGGTKNTNAPSYRGDSEAQWAKMLDPMGATVIMTNRPLALKQFMTGFKGQPVGSVPIQNRTSQSPIEPQGGSVNQAYTKFF